MITLAQKAYKQVKSGYQSIWWKTKYSDSFIFLFNFIYAFSFFFFKKKEQLLESKEYG